MAWVILVPLLSTGAFVLIFGKLAKMPTDGLPYVLFYFSAMASWNTFASSVSRSALALEVNASLVTKVYFPRVVLPGSIVLGSMIDFLIGWTLLNLICIGMGHWHWQLPALTPLLMLIQACTALGFGTVLAMINAQYHDVKQGISFLIQLMMLATPIIYPLSQLPDWLQQISFINPMASVVTTYRACLSGGLFNWTMISLSFLMGILYLCAGIWFFKRRESRLADIL